MDNQQLYDLKENQKQILYTSLFGDGNLSNDRKICSYSSIYFEYMSYKKEILGDLCTSKISEINQKDNYKKGFIYSIRTKQHPFIDNLLQQPLEKMLNCINAFGLGIWFMDDGSLHKVKNFYNLNSHKFNLEFHENYLVPYFRKFNINAKITKETKKDGTIFYYLRIGKYDGSDIISDLILNHNLDCFSYKAWSSETILKWSKLQEKLKSEDLNNYSNAKLGCIWRDLDKI